MTVPQLSPAPELTEAEKATVERSEAAEEPEEVVDATAEARSLNAALQAERRYGTEILADLLRLTYDVQLDTYPSRASRKESERVADAFRARIAQHCDERSRRRLAALAALRGDRAPLAGEATTDEETNRG